MLAIGMTLLAGAAVFGYVNLQAGVSETAYGQSAGVVVNQMQEKFVVFDVSYPTSGCAGSNCVSLWVYNTGYTNLLLTSIRVSGPSGTINVLYNYTTSGGTKTNYVYDLRGTSTACKLASSSYESPTVSGVNDKISVTQLVTLTIPPTRAGCPSYGLTFVSGTTYTVTVLGYFGNIGTASQVR